MNIKKEFNVSYGQTIEAESFGHISGIVNGKIKDIDAYIVELSGIDGLLWNVKSNARIPNRHLDLDWGHFSGKKCEIIILKEEIVTVYK